MQVAENSATCSPAKSADMKRSIRIIQLSVALLLISVCVRAQVLDVTVANMGSNVIRFTGVPTSPGFDTPPLSSWASMNLTWRIPKTAAVPAPTVAPPATTPEITGEASAFTGAAPRDAFNGGLDLTMFDLTTFGQPDDGFWYFQVTGTVNTAQSISTGNSVILYEFNAPDGWLCPACVEVMLTDVPGIPISTTSFIDNAGTGTDVLNLVTNMIALPVNFLDFTATRKDSKVQLSWKVASEENVKGYYVERSADAANWQTIGFVPFSSPASVNDYSMLDQSPLSPVNYYRIREEDIDGRVIYSVVRSVRMDNKGIKTYLFPVPARNILNVNIQSDINTPVTIRIVDVAGRTLHTSAARITAGSQLETISVSTFKPGIYFIEIQGDNYRWTSKFIKE